MGALETTAIALYQGQADSLLIAMQAQLDATHRFQSDILATVHWALAAVVLITGLLLGFGWFANFRIYDRDKAALKQDLSGLMSQQIADLQKRTDDQIHAARKELVEAARSGTSGEMASLKRQITMLKLDLQKLDVKTDEVANKHGSVVSGSIEWLRMALDIEDQWEIDQALETLLGAIERGGSFVTSELRAVTSLLEKVPADHAVMKEKVSLALRAATVI